MPKKIKIVKESTVLAELEKEVKRTGSQYAAAKSLGVSEASLSLIRRKKFGMFKTVARALGFEPVTMYRIEVEAEEG